MNLAVTPGQTVGPFFGFALPYDGGPALVPAGRADAVRLHGRVLDGAGDPVPDALLELSQPDADGVLPRQRGSWSRDGFDFTGWGRAATDREGRYGFTTVTPGPTGSGAAAYFALTVFARGLLDRLLTRIYLPDDDVVLAVDPVLSSVPSDRRSTLIAERDETGFVFDVRLQGDGETVFLSYPRH